MGGNYYSLVVNDLPRVVQGECTRWEPQEGQELGYSDPCR